MPNDTRTTYEKIKDFIFPAAKPLREAAKQGNTNTDSVKTIDNSENYLKDIIEKRYPPKKSETKKGKMPVSRVTDLQKKVVK
jgi:hypothetical protein